MDKEYDKYDSNKPKQALIFNENWREQALHKIETVNEEERFAITKLTAGGKFVRSDKYLCYNMKGIEVYTDINNIIFVDLHDNTLFIKEFAKIEKNINTKSPEDRQYIILYTDLGFNDDYKDFPLRWEAYTGRTPAYEAIKLNLPVIDIDKSIVLTDNVPLKDAISIREFIDHLQNAGFVDPEEINLDDYSSSEYI